MEKLLEKAVKHQFKEGDEVLILEAGRGWFGKYTGTYAKIVQTWFDKQMVNVVLYDGKVVMSHHSWIQPAKYTKTPLYEKLKGKKDE